MHNQEMKKEHWHFLGLCLNLQLLYKADRTEISIYRRKLKRQGSHWVLSCLLFAKERGLSVCWYHCKFNPDTI